MGIKGERVLVVNPKAQAAERVLKRLGVAIKTFGLYPPNHTVAVRALEGLRTVLRPFLDSYGPFVVRIAKQHFTVDDMTVGGDTYSGLALFLYTRRLAAVTILPPVRDEELAAFLSIAGRDRISLETAGGIEHLLWQAEVGNIQVMELTVDREEGVEDDLGLSAFLALIGRGRLAPRERKAILDILFSAEQTAQLLQNIYRMSPEVFSGIRPEEQVQHAYEAVRTLDRLILDEPLEEQPRLYTNLGEALLLIEPPLGTALPHLLVARAREDTTAKFLLIHLATDQLAEIVIRTVPVAEMAAQVLELLRLLSLPDRKAEALISLLERRAQPPGADSTWLSGAVLPLLRQAAEARVPEVPPEFVFDDSLIFVDQDELAARLREAKAIDEAASIREVIITLIDILRNETDEGEQAEVAETLAGFLPWMVEQQEFRMLAAVTEHLRQIAATAEDRRGTLAAGVIRRLTEHPLLDRLLDVLWARRDTPAEREVRACLEALGGAAVTPLVHVMGGEPRAGMRAALCDLLVVVGRDHVAELGGFVADDRWYVVRNIASILGRLQTPTATVSLERIINHPEHRVRREVVDALARLGTEEAQSLLGRMLDDPDQRIRLAAMRALNAWGTRRALRKLLAIAAAVDPFQRLFTLKTAALEALERLGSREAVPVLKRIARNPFALGQRRRALRNLARRALLAIEGQVPEAEGRMPTTQSP